MWHAWIQLRAAACSDTVARGMPGYSCARQHARVLLCAAACSDTVAHRHPPMPYALLWREPQAQENRPSLAPHVRTPSAWQETGGGKAKGRTHLWRAGGDGERCARKERVPTRGGGVCGVPRRKGQEGREGNGGRAECCSRRVRKGRNVRVGKGGGPTHLVRECARPPPGSPLSTTRAGAEVSLSRQLSRSSAPGACAVLRGAGSPGDAPALDPGENADGARKQMPNQWACVVEEAVGLVGARKARRRREVVGAGLGSDGLTISMTQNSSPRAPTGSGSSKSPSPNSPLGRGCSFSRSRRERGRAAHACGIGRTATGSVASSLHDAGATASLMHTAPHAIHRYPARLLTATCDAPATQCLTL